MHPTLYVCRPPLSFAKDDDGSGNFQPFASWIDSGIKWQTVTDDRKAYAAKTGSQRTYMISLGGAADYGGTFRVAGVTPEQWVENAFKSVSSIINSFGALPRRRRPRLQWRKVLMRLPDARNLDSCCV